MTDVLSLAELESFDPSGGRGGKERRFLCPLCHGNKKRDDSHRSLALNADTGAWLCHRCEKRGLIREKWTERPSGQGTNRKNAPRKAVSRAFGLSRGSKPATIPETSQEWREIESRAIPIAGTPGAEYLLGRGIPLDVQTRAGVMFLPSGPGGPAVLFRILNDSGETVAIETRSISGSTRLARGPKKLGAFLGSFSPTPEKWPSQVAITEAALDALSLAVVGVPAIATMGAGNIAPWLPKRLAMRTVYMAQDNDEAGEKAAKGLAEQLVRLGARVFRFRPPAGKDWNDSLLAIGAPELSECIQSVLGGSTDTPRPPIGPAMAIVEPHFLAEPEKPDAPELDGLPPLPLRLKEKGVYIWNEGTARAWARAEWIDRYSKDPSSPELSTIDETIAYVQARWADESPLVRA